MNCSIWKAIAVLVLVSSTGISIGTHAARATVVFNRAALESALGGPGSVENFEGYVIGSGQGDLLRTPVLYSGTIANSQGPNLVLPDITFIASDGGSLQWDGPNYFGSLSKELLTGPNSPTLTIDFSSPQRGFGVDIRSFASFATTASLQVFAADDTTVLGSATVSLPASGAPVFIGWEHFAGVGKALLTQSGGDVNWSPAIDNLQFANVPELPAAALWSVLVGTGLVTVVARRAWQRAMHGGAAT